MKYFMLNLDMFMSFYVHTFFNLLDRLIFMIKIIFFSAFVHYRFYPVIEIYLYGNLLSYQPITEPRRLRQLHRKLTSNLPIHPPILIPLSLI